MIKFAYEIARRTFEEIYLEEFRGGLLLLSNISLASVGFSSWVTGSSGSSHASTIIVASIGNVKDDITIENYIYYVFDSEYAFEYFSIVDGEDVRDICTSSRLGFRIKLCSSELEKAIAKLSPKPSELWIDINVSYETTDDFDMFSKNNANAVVPSGFVFSLEENPEYVFASDELEASYSKGTDKNYGLIASRTLLFEEGENSLLEFTKTFSTKSGTEYTFYNVYLPFELKDSFSFENYKKLSFSFSVSLNRQRE